MIQFDIPKEQSSIIKVIGMGGGGSNAVNFMYEQGIEGVDFIICNTDSQALADSPIPNKVHLGPHLTQGLGAGANPAIGRQATEESMEELKKILEVNTKMAFITAGMGGGTGTGGAPIVARICKELGILTVGIVTSPFSYEGRRRMKQAEEGIKNLKEYVDTLLVISNDKLRMQFGNLPFKSAFAKADNILATAAKCITDVINIHGVVNVDFADVCTAMRSGGVAILGSATADGENRSQKAIDSALSSPLLNDSDISGAKWILLNITSAEGEHEHTIDEMDTIQAYVQQQAGDECDVILGMGHDNTLEAKLGVTIIATGFQQKPIRQMMEAKKPVRKEEPRKITMELGKKGEEQKMYDQNTLPFKEEEEDPMAPKLVRHESGEQQIEEEAVQEPAAETPPQEAKEEKYVFELKDPKELNREVDQEKESPSSPPSASGTYHSEAGGYLSRPRQIYVERPEPRQDHERRQEQPAPDEQPEDQEEMKLFYKKEPVQPKEETFRPQPRQPQVDRPREEPPHEQETSPATEYLRGAEAEKQQEVPEQTAEQLSYVSQDQLAAQQKAAEERRSRLRELSFDVKKMEDPYEVETVPAYIRKNISLQQNSEPSAEDPYSGYHVKKTADGKQTEISTINTFLDGKKPD